MRAFCFYPVRRKTSSLLHGIRVHDIIRTLLVLRGRQARKLLPPFKKGALGARQLCSHLGYLAPDGRDAPIRMEAS